MAYFFHVNRLAGDSHKISINSKMLLFETESTHKNKHRSLGFIETLQALVFLEKQNKWNTVCYIMFGVFGV